MVEPTVSMPKENALTNWFNSDDDFNELFPENVQILAAQHWTPLEVSKTAAAFLASDNNSKILDIGSGCGSFCLAAAHYSPNAFYFGVEQRPDLIKHANQAKKTLGLKNVSFINDNFTLLNFNDYDHFYFFNSFYENLAGTEKIDYHIQHSRELYNFYNGYLFRQLQKMPAGTKLAAYHVSDFEIPPGFHAAGKAFDELLKFYVKL